MCGRYRRRSDKQRIAEAFDVGMGLDELYLDPQDDIAPGSVQPVVLENADGARQIEMMRWGFNCRTASSSMRGPRAWRRRASGKSRFGSGGAWFRRTVSTSGRR